MAINTDAPRATGVLGESAALGSDFGDTEKLLDLSTKELKGELNHKSDTYSVKSQNEKTAENVDPVPLSPTRVDFSRTSSPTPGEREPWSFIWVAVISCFCPAVPINVFALYFAHMARAMIQSKDYEGGRKIGRLSLLLSIVSIIVGSAILLYVAMTEI
ncbi:trafficking regulator of GLUT4 (SLC2A4) 1b [Triplophysa rosa]|uniref:Tumor suppressor candidate 5-like protein n=1 Tax=Triplophysa rosa TaxID=992332 RepID=A0A9W7TFN0_TRIRA|nr:trafficking regulator of GLUT4 (SLC2A4) 1b [Triplophysa rosa]KAI7796064.1 putative tumor suppressor candidate 5-like protein [Triplophysa rosa]